MNVCSYVKDKLRVLGEWRNTAVSGGVVPLHGHQVWGLCAAVGALPPRFEGRPVRRGGVVVVDIQLKC